MQRITTIVIAVLALLALPALAQEMNDPDTVLTGVILGDMEEGEDVVFVQGDDGNRYVVHVTEGIAGSDLAREGNRVTVHYERTGDGNLFAKSIELVGSTTTAISSLQPEPESELEQDVEEVVADIDEEVDSAFDSIDEEADETAADIGEAFDQVGDEIDDVDEEIVADLDDDADLDTTTTDLPATGSSLPLVALFGGLFLAGAAVLRFLR